MSHCTGVGSCERAAVRGAVGKRRPLRLDARVPIGQLLLHAGDPLRMVVGEVVLLTRIGGEVEQLGRLALVAAIGPLEIGGGR